MFTNAASIGIITTKILITRNLRITTPVVPGGDPAQGRSAGRDCPGVLQLWSAERVRAGLHPRQGGQCGGAAVQAAVRGAEQPQGYELGAGALATSHIGQVANMFLTFAMNQT